MKGKMVYYYGARCMVSEIEKSTGCGYLEVMSSSDFCPYVMGEMFPVCIDFIRAYLGGARNCEMLA